MEQYVHCEKFFTETHTRKDDYDLHPATDDLGIHPFHEAQKNLAKMIENR